MIKQWTSIVATTTIFDNAAAFRMRQVQPAPGWGKWRRLQAMSVAVLLIGLIWVAPASAGRYAAAFLDIGIGARGLGMGGAYITLARNVTAFHWNPAGLAYVRSPQLGFMYATQFGSLIEPLSNFNYAGGAIPLPGGASLAVNWIRLASDEIPLYPELAGDNLGQRLRDSDLRPTGEPLGFFSDQEMAYYFTFAKLTTLNVDWGYEMLEFPLEIPIGINLKLLQQQLHTRKASGLGVDIGFMLRFGVAEMFNNENLGKFSFGFLFKDVSRTILSWDTRQRDEIAPRYRWGFSYEHPIRALDGGLTLSWQNRDKFEDKIHYGIEFHSRAIFLRMGSNDGNFTAGTGVNIWKLRIDYAFTGYDLGNVHRLSGILSF